MTERITFGRVEAVLAELGFKKTVVLGSHVNYEHPEAGAIFPLRLHKALEVMPSYVLAAVRHDLEVLGVIAGSELEEMLKAAAA